MISYIARRLFRFLYRSKNHAGLLEELTIPEALTQEMEWRGQAYEELEKRLDKKFEELENGQIRAVNEL